MATLTAIGADNVAFGADGVAFGVADAYTPYGPAIPYAQDLITAAGITNATQQQVVRQLVADFLACGVLDRYSRADSRLKVWYPVVGGTADAHKFNLVDPGTYPLQYFNAPVHSDANGIDFQGRAYANTGFILDSLNGETEGSSLYYRTTDNTTDVGFEIGALGTDGSGGSGGIQMLTLHDDNSGNLARAYAGQPLANSAVSLPDSRGLFASSFSAGSQTIGLYRNGQLISSPVASNGAAPILPCFIGTFNINGNPFSGFTRRRCTGAGIATGFSDSQQVAFAAAVLRFNTTLGRAV